MGKEFLGSVALTLSLFGITLFCRLPFVIRNDNFRNKVAKVIGETGKRKADRRTKQAAIYCIVCVCVYIS